MVKVTVRLLNGTVSAISAVYLHSLMTSGTCSLDNSQASHKMITQVTSRDHNM